jgi:hypothetical protein
LPVLGAGSSYAGIFEFNEVGEGSSFIPLDNDITVTDKFANAFALFEKLGTPAEYFLFPIVI